MGEVRGLAGSGGRDAVELGAALEAVPPAPPEGRAGAGATGGLQRPGRRAGEDLGLIVWGKTGKMALGEMEQNQPRWPWVA